METFNSDRLKSGAYRSVIVQKGGSVEMDRYIYNLEGEGLGGWFGSLLKTAIPLIGSTIKGAAKIAKPYAKAAGKEIITAGAKRGAQQVTKRIVHRPHKKRKRKTWQSI